MNKDMFDLNVSTTEDGKICISQSAPFEEDDDMIIFHPEQSDLLIKWILEAKEELDEK